MYTVFVRLPFPRGDFLDPPPANWDAVKDRALWEILSRPTKGDMDWKAIADDFNVTLSFLLQQAAWLYDRQLSQVRAQMRKVGNTQSQSPGTGSVSGSGALGGQAMRRAGSGGSRAPSRLSAVQKEIQPARDAAQKDMQPARDAARTESSSKAKGIAPVRTNSATTVTQAETERAPATFSGRPRRARPSLAILQRPPAEEAESPSFSPESNSESDSDLDNDDDDDDDDVPRRFGKYSMHKPSLRDDADDESPAFLPLPREEQHMHSTLRQQEPRRQMTGYTPSHRRDLASLDSSASSGVAVQPVSPRVASLSRESSRRHGSAHQSNEDTVSMGSSFSDLDDASVTQSALEEALMSNMQHGAASRMSTISQALRSRYL